MLDKRRNRRMNGVLRGLGDNGDDIFSYVEDAAAEPVMPDIPIDEGAGGVLPDIPTTFDTPKVPAATNYVDLLNKGLNVGAQVYKYVQPARSASHATAAHPRPKSSLALPLLVLGVILLMNR